MRPLLTATALVASLVLAPAAGAAGGTLAYTQGSSSIDTVPAGGGTPSQLIAGGTLPAYSPTGSQIAYISRGAVYVAKASGAGAKKVASGLPTKSPLSPGGPPAWSPNGKQLAYSDGNNLWVVSATGGRAKQVPGATNGFIDVATHPVWSHNGQSLFYVAIDQAASVEYSVNQLYTIPVAGAKNPQQLPIAWGTSWLLQQYSLSISPSGRSLAVTVGAFGTFPATSVTTAIVSTKGGTATILPGAISAAAFAPSGQQLCAQSEAGLVTATLGGTVLTTLVPTGSAGAPVACAWQP